MTSLLETSLRAERHTWEAPIAVEDVVACRLMLRRRIEDFDGLIDAVNGIDMRETWSELERTMPWGNFIHLYRDELLRRFGSDEHPDRSI